jgi:NADH-quinone oxidoreductase subunit M
MVTDFPLLSALILVPLLTSGLIGLVPSARRREQRATAMAGAAVTFVLSVVVLVRFTSGEGGFQLGEVYGWVPEYGINYRIGIDGVSLFLVLLTTLLMPLVVLAAWEQTDRAKGFFGSLLVLEAALIGVFLALDLVLFYFFFEVTLVPMYALIGIWGGRNRRYAALKFFLYTLVGGLLMLVGIVYLYFDAGAQSFDYGFILENAQLSSGEQTWLFLAFFTAFAIKVPLFPLHTWLPDAHTEAPTVGSVLLAAVLLKIGGYGFLRYALPFFPDAALRLAPAVLVLAVIGILYGALVAALQRDIKKLVAYSSVAHLGFVVLGTFAISETAASGSVVQMVNHGLSTGTLFLLIGFLYDRTHSREIADHSGILKAAPVLGGLFLFATMSSVALPGLNGFVGEFPILLGSFQTVRWAAVLATFGVVLAAFYLLWAYQRMFHGPVAGHAEGMTDLVPREIAVVAPLAALMLFIGLYPGPIYDRVNPSVALIVQGVRDAEVPGVRLTDETAGR